MQKGNMVLVRLIGIILGLFIIIFTSGAALRVRQRQGIRSTPTGTPIPERTIKIPTLLYHYISVNPMKEDVVRTGLSTTPYIFEQQLRFLSENGFTTLTLDDIIPVLFGTSLLPPKPVLLTFDDGYTDFYTDAYPLLVKYHAKATAFIPTGFIGGKNYMTWEQIDVLKSSPLVRFGAHSVHHYALTNVSPKIMQSEIDDSKSILESHVGSSVNWFAYPYGAYNDIVVQAVREVGFIGAVTTELGSIVSKDALFVLPRVRPGMRTGNELLKILL